MRYQKRLPLRENALRELQRLTGSEGRPQLANIVGAAAEVRKGGRHNASNDIPAEVIEIKTGGVMAHVKVKLVGTDYAMSSVMTLESLAELGIETGSRVHVLAKAVNVLLVKP